MKNLTDLSPSSRVLVRVKKTKPANQPRWQKEQKKKKRKLIGQIFVRVATVFCIFIILFLGVKIWQTFKNSRWDGKHEVNFVVQTEDVTIFSFNPQKRFLNILKIPADTYIPVAKGYGEFKIKNIYKLGQMEKIGGGELLNRSIQRFFAIPIDGWIKLKNYTSQSRSDNTSSYNLENNNLLPVFLLIIKRQAETNLSWWDLSRLFWQTKNLNIDQINKVDLEKTSFISKETLGDGSQVFKFEITNVDDLTIRLFSDEEVLKEDLQVIVLNGTDHQGLAKDMARVVKNLGAELIGVKDYNKKIDQSQIFCQSRSQTTSYTVHRIARSFAMKINPDFTSGEKLNDQEVDLTIILGEDFWQKFYAPITEENTP